MSQAPGEGAEVALLRALAQEQLKQITDLTRRLAAAQGEVSADPQLLRAGMDALERRLQDSREIALGREAALAAQILSDGTSLQSLQVDLDAATAATGRQQAEADRQAADLQRRLAELDGALRAAHEDTKALRADLDRIYASHSWKLTEPLRAGRRLLGGG